MITQPSSITSPYTPGQPVASGGFCLPCADGQRFKFPHPAPADFFIQLR
jgi:hypothetical protein